MESNLFCDEVLDLSELAQQQQQQQQPQPQQQQQPQYSHCVPALQDLCQVKDDRILQNLLRNEERFLPKTDDYMRIVQFPNITADMRSTVAEWMLDVVRDQDSQPEVFCLAMNILDRFLSRCKILKSQLQLLGAVAILIASKIWEPEPIPGRKLIEFTDFSIMNDELKDWELLVLYKLQWELTAITPLDFLDHVLPRLGLNAEESQMIELRRRTETALVLSSTHYAFAYKNPSLLAAAAIMISLKHLNAFKSNTAAVKEIKLRLQTITHTSTAELDECGFALNTALPEYLKEPPVHGDDEELPDSTSSSSPPEPDLVCKEILPDDSVLFDESNNANNNNNNNNNNNDAKSSTSTSRSSSPLSAVDIFTDFNASVLKHVFEQADQSYSSSSSTILVS